MELPAYFTVKEVLEAKRLELQNLQDKLDEAKLQVTEASKPVYIKVSGLLKNHITEVDPTDCKWGNEYYWEYYRLTLLEEKYSSGIQVTLDQINALSKLPNKAKVKLTVKEINHLELHRD